MAFPNKLGDRDGCMEEAEHDFRTASHMCAVNDLALLVALNIGDSRVKMSPDGSITAPPAFNIARNEFVHLLASPVRPDIVIYSDIEK